MRHVSARFMGSMLAIGLLVAGCGSSSTPTTPSPSPAPAPAPAPTNASLGGVVFDANGSRIGGARVTVLDGPSAGTSVVADSLGIYKFDAIRAAGTNFSASASGYQEDRRGVVVNGTNTLDFFLTVIPAPAPLISVSTRLISGGGGSSTQEWGMTASIASGVSVKRWDWSFGDGTSAGDTGASEQHVYRSKGTFQVIVTVTKTDGSVITGSATISIS